VADKTDLMLLPQSCNSALILSEANTSLIARGRREGSVLLLQKREPVCLAAVKINGK
jgi:hypothetical protein